MSVGDTWFSGLRGIEIPDHVVNHGTDHRAQLLRLLNELGVKTTSQVHLRTIQAGIFAFHHRPVHPEP